MLGVVIARGWLLLSSVRCPLLDACSRFGVCEHVNFKDCNLYMSCTSPFWKARFLHVRKVVVSRV